MWLYKNHFKLRDEPTAQQQRILIQGTNVGLLARKLFDSGVDASPIDVFHYRESVRNTAKFIAEGQTIIFEAAFQYEGVLCAVDILLKHRGKWYAYEVKSSTGLKDQYIQDAALQYFVLTNSGLEVEDFFIVHINTGYVRLGNLQLKQLFVKHSIKNQVNGMQPFINSRTAQLKLITIQKQMPNIEIGLQCNIPYTCDFYGFCHQKDPMFQNNIPHVISSEVENSKIVFFEPLLHFLYIGTYRVAVPEYDGHWPYRHIPFQYSYITLNNDGDTEVHFVAKNGSDPIIQFVENFINIADSNKQIIVSNKAFVLSRLAELQRDYPDYSIKLNKIKERLGEIAMENNAHIQSYIDADTDDVSNAIATDEDAAAVWYNQKNYPLNDENTLEKVLIKYAVSRLKILINLVSINK